MSSNTNIGNTPVNQGYVQLIHTGETGGIDGTLRTLYDGDGTAADLLIASDKVKVSTELFIGAKTLTEFIQDTVGTMFTTGNSLTNVSVTYDDANNNIDLNATGEVTLTGSQTLTNKTLTSPVINTSVSGTAILDEDNMSSNSDSKLATQQSIKAYVDAEVSSLVSSAPTALDTLDELAAALGDDANFATTTATSLGEKLVKASNLSDLTNTTTARSNLGLGSLATANNISVSNFNDAALQTSSESFADNDTSLMTSAAIQDKIESFGFTTNTGDMTGVSITASNPLDISQSNTTSGSYSATISLVASEFGGYLSDMSDAIVGDTDDVVVLDNGTLKKKQFDSIRLTAFDATGFSAGAVSAVANGSDNRIATFSSSDALNGESTLTWNGSDYLNVQSADGAEGGIRLKKSSQDSTHTTYSISHRDDNQTLIIYSYDGTTFRNWITLDEPNALLKLGSNSSALSSFNSDGDLDMHGDIEISATNKLYLDGGGNTYIFEESADQITMSAGGGNYFKLSNTNLVVNDPGASFDFRVEGDTDQNLLFTDGSTDRVGIGTNSPQRKFHVSTGNTDIAARFENTTSNGSVAEFISSGDSRTLTIQTDHIYSNGNLFFGLGNYTNTYRAGTHIFQEDTGNTEVMRITGNNVGIGVTSPGEKLDLRGGNFRVGGFNTGSDYGAIFTPADSASYWHIYNDAGGHLAFGRSATIGSSEKMRINSSGNVGIGTSSPSAKLDIENSTAPTLSNDTHAGEAIFLRSGGSAGDGNVQAVLAFGKADGSSRRSGSAIASVQTDSDVDKVGIGFYTSDSSASSQTMDQRMLLDHTGSVGIGTTSPDTLLHVDEDDSATAFKVTGGSGGNKIASFIRDEGVSSPHAEVYIHAGSGDPQITFRDVGNEYFSIGLDDSANSFKISDNTGVGTNDRLTIDSSGDIKIEESLGIGVSASGTTGRLDCSNDVVAFASSDKRLKENIKPLDNALDKINKINGVEFDWKKLTKKEKETIHGNTGHDVGVIAQEIEEVLPEVVTTRDNGYKAVKYEKIVPLLIEAIKELKQEIEELR